MSDHPALGPMLAVLALTAGDVVPIDVTDEFGEQKEENRIYRLPNGSLIKVKTYELLESPFGKRVFQLTSSHVDENGKAVPYSGSLQGFCITPPHVLTVEVDNPNGPPLEAIVEWTRICQVISCDRIAKLDRSPVGKGVKMLSVGKTPASATLSSVMPGTMPGVVESRTL